MDSEAACQGSFDKHIYSTDWTDSPSLHFYMNSILQVGTDPMRLGSVAKWMSEQREQPVPIVIVRNAKGQAPPEANR